jgi:hypothetical protein
MAKGVACYPLNREARRRWHAEQAPAYVPHPEPEVYARDAQPAEVPLGARRIAKTAEANGWNVRITYARGTVLRANGKPGKVVDDILVRMARPTVGGYSCAVATWIDGSYEFAYVGHPGEVGRKVGARDLRAFLECPQAAAAAVAA